MTSDTIQVLIGGLLLLAVLGVVAVLTWHGTISGNEAYGICTTIVSIGAGAFAVHAGVNAGARAAKHTTEPTKKP
jgi:type IV secretory pathway TrbL component